MAYANGGALPGRSMRGSPARGRFLRSACQACAHLLTVFNGHETRREFSGELELDESVSTCPLVFGISLDELVVGVASIAGAKAARRCSWYRPTYEEQCQALEKTEQSC